MADACTAEKSLYIVVPRGSPVFLDKLPARSGPRPKTNPCLPHQQRSDIPNKEVWERMVKRVFDNKATLFPGSTGPKRSLVSLPDSLALFLDEDDSTPCKHPIVGKEWGHLHGASDGSMHIGMSEADASTVIKSGWGERHLLAGQTMNNVKIPEGLIMVYAPRTDEEIEIIVDILKASHKWARGDIEPLTRSE